MSVLITGVSGSGKTTIASELTKRNYSALNMDNVEGLCDWINLATGKPELDFNRESADWLDKYDWQWHEERLVQLLRDFPNTFFCGSSGNQDKFYQLFDKIFLLEMNDELIRERLFNNVRDHDYGQRPGELEAILGYYKGFQDKAKRAGAIAIEASQPLSQTIDFILAEAEVKLQ